MKNESSFYPNSRNPLWILIWLGGCHVILVVGAKILQLMQVMETSERFPWMAGAAMLFVSAMFSAVLLVSTKNVSMYMPRVIYSFIGLIISTNLVAWLFTGKTIGEVGSFKWIYLVLTFAFLLFLGIMFFVRQMLTFAEEEEWEGPRRK